MNTVDTLDRYRRAQEGFDATMAAVPAGGFDAPSMCADWTVADVAGHVIWGQHLVRHLATGVEFTDVTGAPGAAKPRELAGTDPLARWQEARAASVATLSPDVLGSIVTIGGLGEVPLDVMVTILVTDHLIHTWDIARALGLDDRLDADLVPPVFASIRPHVTRAPGMFGPELTPAPGADEQTRLLAFLGRA